MSKGKNKQPGILKLNMDNLREESVAGIEEMAHVAICAADDAKMATMKSGKLEIVEADEDGIAHAAHRALRGVLGLGMTVCIHELDRRQAKGDDNAKAALQRVAEHGVKHQMSIVAKELLGAIGGHIIGSKVPKKPGDKKSPSDFRVDLNRLKPSDN